MSILIVAGLILFVLLDVLALVFVFRRLAVKRAAVAQAGTSPDAGPPRSAPISRVLVGLALVIGLVVASTYGLGALNGAVPDDLRCKRTQAAQSCEILGSIGLGLVGDRVSLYIIPETSILGAESHFDRGNRGGTYWVRLMLADGSRPRVMSYPWKHQTEEAAARINAYLHDESMAAFEERQDAFALLLQVVGSILATAAVLGLVAFAVVKFRRRKGCPEQSAPGS